ncbi:MAG TPA: GGDEF domain-containing protein [Nitrospinaceae bacterium]|jgi:diguanylate cyclase (GGDEF)-like protein|nr:GGDEF domain-containing protein [Nitrospinaceae bacterium]HIB42987.1 GGDEF domain-containing protein [Nitrospina sp.]HIN88247.1 GGDEF domain-containing protein [Nitrospinaceae bacterium]
MSKNKWDQPRYQELIDLHKAISLLSLEQISSVLVDRLPSVFSIDYFTLFLYDQDKRKLNLMCHNHPEIESSFSISLSSSPIMEAAVLRGQYIREQDFSTSSYYRGADNPLFKKGYFVSIPLMIEKEVVGVLNINDVDQDSFNVGDLGFILNLSELIAMSISNAVLYEQTKKLAVTDGLTGISNRPNMEQSLLSEFERSKRYNSPLSVVLLDVDHFKDVNDSYGHQKGDEILVTFASVLKKFCRANDTAARYGGEEFLMILPQSNAQGAFKIAERVREEIMKMSFVGNDSKFSVTTSCGVAELNRDYMKNTDQLINVADNAMYEAKNSGRNKTIIGSVEKK